MTALLVSLLVVSVPGPSASAAGPVTVTDLLHLRSVTKVSVAWDGSRAVYAVRSVGAEPGSDRLVNQSHLFLLDLTTASAQPRQLTFGPQRDGSPVISPDGMSVAFERTSAMRDAPPAQVWVLPLDGGEARPVTSLRQGAGDPVWSPDGRRLLVGADVPLTTLPGVPLWADARPGRSHGDVPAGTQPKSDGDIAQIRAWLDANAAEQNPAVITRLHFQEDHGLRAKRTVRHLFLVDLNDLAAEPRRVTSGFSDHRHAAFLGSEHIVYTARKVPDRDPDELLGTDLWKIGVDGSNDALLLSLEGWSLERPMPSRDGNVIAFVAQQLDAPAHRPAVVGTLALTADGVSAPTWLTGSDVFDLPVEELAWVPAQPGLYFTVARRGGFPLMTMAEGLLEPAVVVEAIDGSPAGVHAFCAGGGHIVYAATTARNPCVLRVRDARGRDWLAHDLNEWTADRQLAAPREGWVDRPDGFRVQYWTMRPVNLAAPARAPLVLQIHGGPNVMWGPGEDTMWLEFQLLCSRGFGVVYANPRGSTGYGYPFERANFQDWAAGPAGDVLAALDRAAVEEWVDPGSLFVTGGSYGGYLTAWIVGNDHRFSAAVAQRGVYDLTTFFGEGNAFQLVEWEMGGFPWNPRVRTILQRESPFTYVNRIRTPLLILHASDDLRTGVSQSQMLYRALKQLGKPVEYVRYPGAGHDLSRTGDPKQRMDRLNRIVEFFERFRGE